MSKIVSFLEDHPLIIAGGVLVVGLGYVFLSSGSSGATSTSSSAVDPNVLNAQVQEAATQAQLQGQTAQINGQLQLANIQASAQQYQTQLTAQLQAYQTQASVQQTQLQVSGQEAINQSNNDTTVAVNAANTAASVTNTQNNDATTLGIQQIISAAGLATTQALVDGNVKIAGLNDQTTALLGQFNSQTQIAEANDQTAAITGIAKTNAGSSEFGDITGLIGKGIGALAGL
jgi:hypothetical protein